MTEALITELGKISTLRVLSYRSAIRYRQAAQPLSEIAAELKVDALLEGAVLRSGDRVRITANLVQAVPERHLWAESFEFDQRDVLAVQGEVARDVARQVRVKLTPQEQVRLTSSRRVDPEAYEAYLLGRAHSYKTYKAANWARAKEYFEKAIERDPGFAPAYASLADLYSRGWASPLRTQRDFRVQARQWAEKTLKLDNTLPEAHTALARIAQQEWDWAGAERAYRRAIELNPSDAAAHIWYAFYLSSMQRSEEAVAQAKRAQRLDPVSPLINTWAGHAYFFAGRVEEANASLQKALELDPSYSTASWLLARSYTTLGMNQQAIAELQRALVLNAEDPDPSVLGALAHVYARVGRRQEALQLVSELKRIEAEGRRYVQPQGFIHAYAGLGDKEQAFARLERAYREGANMVLFLNQNPFLDPLRSDPRFDDLVRRIGLPNKSPSRLR
jgi:Tfp pilus assembly protein PilF